MHQQASSKQWSGSCCLCSKLITSIICICLPCSERFSTFNVSFLNPELHLCQTANATKHCQTPQTLCCVQAHADNLTVQSYQTPSQPAQAQVAVKAQSLATHAQSLEAQAEAQNLQAQAQVHAHAQAEAQAQAQHLAAQAQAHAQAQAQANAHASQLKSAASFGECCSMHFSASIFGMPLSRLGAEDGMYNCFN